MSRPNIKCDVEMYAPPSQRYYAIDLSTYSGESGSIGRGPTKQDAISDLLERLAERAPQAMRRIDCGSEEPCELVPIPRIDDEYEGEEAQ